MTAEKEHLNLFGGQLIAHESVKGVEFHLFDNRIFYVKLPRYEKIGTDVIQLGYDFLDRNGGGQFYNVYHFGSFADVEAEVREWAADPEGNDYTICDALVIDSLGQKIITDFYMRFNKPIKPTRAFFSLEKAKDWIFEQIESTE